jgi:hypothetical protein
MAKARRLGRGKSQCMFCGYWGSQLGTSVAYLNRPSAIVAYPTQANDIHRNNPLPLVRGGVVAGNPTGLSKITHGCARLVIKRW